MRAILVITRRELQSYFVSPIAYAVIVGFLMIVGFGVIGVVRRFLGILTSFSLEEFTIQEFFINELASWTQLAIILCLPALSMRLFTEERKAGTVELLMTSPVNTWQLVLGKYLGAVAVYLLVLFTTFGYMAFLGLRGKPEWAAVAATFLGMLLYGAVVLAVGLFGSSLAENQIVALVVTYAIFLPLDLVRLLIGLVSVDLGDVISGVSVDVSFWTLAAGVLDTHHLVLFGSLVFVFLFLSAQVLDSSRWK